MSVKHKVRINQGRILPMWLRLLLTFGMFSGMMYSMHHLAEEAAILLSILFAIPVFPIWNTYYLFEIDNDLKMILKGYWAAGFTWGKWIPYQDVKEIKILGPKNGKPGSQRSGNKAYKAFLITGDGQEIFVVGNSSRTRLEELMREITIKLQINGVD